MKKYSLLLVLLALMNMPALAILPSAQLKDIYGKTVRTEELSKAGKPLLISFWATYCKPCIRELKAISELYPDWQEETGVRIIIVSVDPAQDAQKVAPMVNGYGWEYDCLLDPNGDFKRAMNVQNVPHAFIVDRKGNIVWQHSGYTDGGEEEIYQQLKKLK